jgi:hypothetical protein
MRLPTLKGERGMTVRFAEGTSFDEAKPGAPTIMSASKKRTIERKQTGREKAS